jgi:hypothetical protein
MGALGHRMRWNWAQHVAIAGRPGRASLPIGAHASGAWGVVGRDDRVTRANGEASIARPARCRFPRAMRSNTRPPVLLRAVDQTPPVERLNAERGLLDRRRRPHRTAVGRNAHQRHPAAHQQQEHTPRTRSAERCPPLRKPLRMPRIRVVRRPHGKAPRTSRGIWRTSSDKSLLRPTFPRAGRPRLWRTRG